MNSEKTEKILIPVSLGKFIDIGTHIDSPDLYFRRKGSLETLGTVFKKEPEDYRDDSFYKIKINNFGEKYLDKGYLYILLEYLKLKGTWKSLAGGTTNLVNLSLKDVKNIKLSIEVSKDDLEQFDISKNSSHKIDLLFKALRLIK